MLSDARLSFTLVPWGSAYIPEIANAASRATAAQRAFEFTVFPDTIPFAADEYQLANGAFDLRRAGRALRRDQRFHDMSSNELILVTAAPHSDEEAAHDYGTKSLVEQCYFYHDTFSEPKTSIISTYIWDRLPPIDEVLITNAGRRSLGPYLFLCFAMIGLSRCLDRPVPHHEDIRGCPLDYCDAVQENDRFFQGGRLCEECQRVLRSHSKIMPRELDSVKKLLLMATGRDYEYDVAITFAGTERTLAEYLASRMRESGLKVFYDNFYIEELIGRNLSDFFDNVYRKNSRFCVMLASHEYERRIWTIDERQNAQARAREEMGDGYIIPVVVDPGVVDDGPLSGILKKTAYLSVQTHPPDEIARILIRRFQQPKGAARTATQ